MLEGPVGKLGGGGTVGVVQQGICYPYRVRKYSAALHQLAGRLSASAIMRQVERQSMMSLNRRWVEDEGFTT